MILVCSFLIGVIFSCLGYDVYDFEKSQVNWEVFYALGMTIFVFNLLVREITKPRRFFGKP